MSLYVESSALAKRYLDEPDSDACGRILDADQDWLTGRHTYVEIAHAIGRGARGDSRLIAVFAEEWHTVDIVELDQQTCEAAADFAVTLQVRTLDSLHLAAAHVVGGGALPFLTYDLRLAQAARSLGWVVLGT